MNDPTGQWNRISRDKGMVKGEQTHVMRLTQALCLNITDSHESLEEDKQMTWTGFHWTKNDPTMLKGCYSTKISQE